MPSFTINNWGEDYVNIRIRPTSPYTAYRVFIRYADDSDSSIYDEWYSGISYSFDVRVDNLDPGTEYAVNVAYNTSPTSSGAQWIGTEYFTTDGSGPGPDPGPDPGGGTYYATLRFDANGGYGEPNDVDGETENDDQYVRMRIPTDEPYRDGYVFVRWELDDPSASRTDYYPGDYINVWGSESGETYWLYAVWEEDGSGIWVWNGSWRRAKVWVWNGSWRQATPWVWNGSWRKGI